MATLAGRDHPHRGKCPAWSAFGKKTFRLEMSSRRVKNPFEGPPGASHHFIVIISRAPSKAAEGIKDGIAGQHLVLLRGERAPISREELLTEIGPAVPRAVFQADEVADGRGGFRALPVDDAQPGAGRIPEPVTRLEIPVAGNGRDVGAEPYEPALAQSRTSACCTGVSSLPAWSRCTSTRLVSRLTSAAAPGVSGLSCRRPSSRPACRCTSRSSSALSRDPRTGWPGTADTTMISCSGSAAASSGTRPGPSACAQPCRAATSRA